LFQGLEQYITSEKGNFAESFYNWVKNTKCQFLERHLESIEDNDTIDFPELAKALVDNSKGGWRLLDKVIPETQEILSSSQNEIETFPDSCREPHAMTSTAFEILENRLNVILLERKLHDLNQKLEYHESQCKMIRETQNEIESNLDTLQLEEDKLLKQMSLENLLLHIKTMK
jgi:hypothetical protein